MILNIKNSFAIMNWPIYYSFICGLSFFKFFDNMKEIPKYLDVVYLPPCESKESLEKKDPGYQSDNFYEGEIKENQLVGLPVHIEHMFSKKSEKIPITDEMFREKLGDKFVKEYPYTHVNIRKHLKVGNVVSNWYDSSKGEIARIKLDDSRLGKLAWEYVGNGRYGQVSLGHRSNVKFTGSKSGGVLVEKNPIEISLVVKGRRPNTDIFQPKPGFMKKKKFTNKRFRPYNGKRRK